jgi:hypothetical protein
MHSLFGDRVETAERGRPLVGLSVSGRLARSFLFEIPLFLVEEQVCLLAIAGNLTLVN